MMLTSVFKRKKDLKHERSESTLLESFHVDVTASFAPARFPVFAQRKTFKTFLKCVYTVRSSFFTI